MLGQLDAALVVLIEPGDDPQQRGFAAARGADECTDLAALEAERQTGRARVAARPRRLETTCA